MSKLNKLFLIGFSGTGKSSVVNIIDQNTEYITCDIDSNIELASSKSLIEIFSQDGESVFRKLEYDAVLNSINSNCHIIAPGGGAVTNHETAMLMKSSGTIVYLYSTPGIIYNRIKDDDGRPLLRNKSFHEIDKMIQHREPIYERYADYKINTDKMSLDQVAQKVVEYYEGINRTR